MESKFKVGDRITLSSVDGHDTKNGLKVGMVGSIVRFEDECVGVQFRGWSGGHGCGYKDIDNCWWANPKQLLHATPQAATLHPSDKVILKHLKKRRSISPMEALASYGCARLAPRIFNLRKAGYPITTKINRDEPGHRYARYHLATESTS